MTCGVLGIIYQIQVWDEAGVEIIQIWKCKLYINLHFNSFILI